MCMVHEVDTQLWRMVPPTTHLLYVFLVLSTSTFTRLSVCMNEVVSYVNDDGVVILKTML